MARANQVPRYRSLITRSPRPATHDHPLTDNNRKDEVPSRAAIPPFLRVIDGPQPFPSNREPAARPSTVYSSKINPLET
jgi:hypothetical protein